jgi:quinol monooxygenase YgiN
LDTLVIIAMFEAKPGKEQALEDFLKSALPLAQAEPATTTWYALKLSASKFAIFDTFPDQAGRETHLKGAIARALFARADELLASPPSIDQGSILAAKRLHA